THQHLPPGLHGRPPDPARLLLEGTAPARGRRRAAGQPDAVLPYSGGPRAGGTRPGRGQRSGPRRTREAGGRPMSAHGTAPEQKSDRTGGAQVESLAGGDLLVELRDAALHVTFNRPHARNAMTNAMYEALVTV